MQNLCKTYYKTLLTMLLNVWIVKNVKFNMDIMIIILNSSKVEIKHYNPNVSTGTIYINKSLTA